MGMFNRTPLTVTKTALDYLTTREKVIASNVANVNTPGYRTKDVSFSSFLKNQNQCAIDLTRTHEKHFPCGVEAAKEVETFYPYNSYPQGENMNDVNLDKEMLKLGDVQTNFNVFSEVLRSKYTEYRSVINGTP